MDIIATPAQAQTVAALPQCGFVRLPTILALIPVGKSLIWEMVARGDFPQPVKLSRRVTAWRSSDIVAFIENRGYGAGR